MPPPALSTAERRQLRVLATLVAQLDHWSDQRTRLERTLDSMPVVSPARGRLLAALLTAQRAHQQAVLDLRDGCDHLCRLVPRLAHAE